MKKINQFVNCYSVSKTLRFKLIPVGKTEENILRDRAIEREFKRSKDYGRMKEILDEYYKDFIDRALKNVRLDENLLVEYKNLFEKSSKTKEDKDALDKITKKFYKFVIDGYKAEKGYANLFKGDLIKKDLKEKCADYNSTDQEILQDFAKFTTYCTGFFENREDMFTAEGKSTEVVYRLFDQNLPKYIANVVLYEKNKEVIDGILKQMQSDFADQIADVTLLLSEKNFGEFITQERIDLYNTLIGGRTLDDGRKLKGINEYLNEHNQVSEKKIPKFSMLYKQILSDRKSLSFLPEQFETDEEVENAVKEYIGGVDLEKISSLCERLATYAPKEVLIRYKEVSNLSQEIFGDWAYIRNELSKEYDENYTEKQRQSKTYINNQDNYFKKLEYVSLATLERITDGKIVGAIQERWQSVATEYETAKNAFVSAKCVDSLLQDKEYVEKLKGVLDALKSAQHCASIFYLSDMESSTLFSNDLSSAMETFSELNALYNKVRNYATQKPYKTDQYKINFENSTLLNGWDLNKETDNNSVLLRKDGTYYLAIMKNGYSRSFVNLPHVVGEDSYEKMVYKYLPSPNKMFPKVFFSEKGKETFQPSARILQIYENGTFKKGENFDLDALHELIDFYKDGIQKYDSWKDFKFDFAPTEKYKDISEFYRNVDEKGYLVRFVPVSKQYVDSLVDEGKLYLFRLYNKDFSEYSHKDGKKNLHTTYFLETFSEENLQKPVYRLNGGAEIFYRPASIAKKAPTHPKGVAIENKNKTDPNAKKTSVFDYDLIKDKRYTENQFTFHVPITLNNLAREEKDLNLKVREALRQNDDNYVIGIDRGERNLLYACVIDGKKNIVEQFSLNEIGGQDYCKLLTKREEDRQKERQDWKSVSGIKDLKQGYLSLVVNRICQLIEKYDAVVAMEDLNFGFKTVRSGIERSVYQQFEKALIDKLNYFVNKDKQSNEVGGSRNAYQLTNKFVSFEKMGKQNGFLFYVPAWNTSKIDPTTGFVDLLKPKYTSVEAAKQFIEKFHSISYDGKLFAFSFDYSSFPRADIDAKKEWTVYSFGDRIETYRNAEKCNQWDSRTVDLTSEFKSLFDRFDIDYTKASLKEQILGVNEKAFFERFIKLLALTLQMRNSVSNSEIDYITSPVKNKKGEFFDSRLKDPSLPKDADANGAYHIALKGAWVIDRIRSVSADELKNVKLAISNGDWLKERQL